MTPIEKRFNNKGEITKTRDFPWRTTKKLENSKDINGKGKRRHEEVVWQEKMKSSRVEVREQHVARDQKYPIKTTFKEARLEKIFWYHKGY